MTLEQIVLGEVGQILTEAALSQVTVVLFFVILFSQTTLFMINIRPFQPPQTHLKILAFLAK